MAKQKGPAIYVAKAAFQLGSQFVPAGATVVAGHELLKGRMELFEPFKPTFGELDPEPAAPEAEPAGEAEGGKA